MIININIKLRPWETPNFVIEETPPRPREEGFSKNSGWPIRELSPETLAAMCDQFRKDVFKKAGKIDPAVPHPKSK